MIMKLPAHRAGFFFTAIEMTPHHFCVEQPNDKKLKPADIEKYSTRFMIEGKQVLHLLC